MTRQNPPKSKKGIGPRRIFTHEQLDHVTLLAKLGATDQEIADYFYVATDVIEYWKRNYPAFSQAARAGKMEADLKVIQSLYMRAVGFEYEEKEWSRQILYDTNGNPSSSEMKLSRITTKKVLPEMKAIAMWLANRHPDKWTEAAHRFDVRHTGVVSHEHFSEKIKTIPIEDLSPAAREILFELNDKQLSVIDPE